MTSQYFKSDETNAEGIKSRGKRNDQRKRKDNESTEKCCEKEPHCGVYHRITGSVVVPALLPILSSSFLFSKSQRLRLFFILRASGNMESS